MIDFSIFYKKRILLRDLAMDSFDLFISCFDKSERVQKVFENVRASSKKWLISPRYAFSPGELPDDNFQLLEADESTFIKTFFDGVGDLTQKKICVDITGFLKPELLFIFYYLQFKGVKTVQVLYAEPNSYQAGHQTSFTNGVHMETRSIQGYEGNHKLDNSNDFLIIGFGYDHDLVSLVTKHKPQTKKVSLFGLPSLQADMYQQSRIRASEVKQDVEDFARIIFAPANDPFITANVISDTIKEYNSKSPISNIYLAPLGTKPQALGFALYYLFGASDQSISVVYPFTKEYPPGRSIGISKVWQYSIELPS